VKGSVTTNISQNFLRETRKRMGKFPKEVSILPWNFINRYISGGVLQNLRSFQVLGALG
jgi:hypothetical protein